MARQDSAHFLEGNPNAVKYCEMLSDALTLLMRRNIHMTWYFSKTEQLLTLLCTLESGFRRGNHWDGLGCALAWHELDRKSWGRLARAVYRDGLQFDTIKYMGECLTHEYEKLISNTSVILSVQCCWECGSCFRCAEEEPGLKFDDKEIEHDYGVCQNCSYWHLARFLWN